MKERFEELEKILEANCRTYENDCTTYPYAKECEKYSKLGRELEEG